jgi:predicted ester cyclase/heme-degrading monooxygenase HmoA
MAHMLVRLAVRDYKVWRPVFDSVADLRREYGEQSHRILRPDDDPESVVVLFDWDNLDNARRYAASPELRAAMERGGVVGRPEILFLEETDGEQNKAIVRRMLDSIRSGDVAVVDEIISPNWVNHDPSLPPFRGREGARQLINLFSSAFSDLHFDIEDMVVEGDKIACRFRFGGINTGSFQGMPPTGKKAEVTATGIFRIVDGKLADNWVNLDALSLLQQLGAVPTPDR